MKIQIESTNIIVEFVPGQKARVWNGTMEDGTPIILYVVLCQADEADRPKLDRALLGQHPEADETTWRLVRQREAAYRHCLAVQAAMNYHPLASP